MEEALNQSFDRLLMMIYNAWQRNIIYLVDTYSQHNSELKHTDYDSNGAL